MCAKRRSFHKRCKLSTFAFEKKSVHFRLDANVYAQGRTDWAIGFYFFSRARQLSTKAEEWQCSVHFSSHLRTDCAAAEKKENEQRVSRFSFKKRQGKILLFFKCSFLHLHIISWYTKKWSTSNLLEKRFRSSSHRLFNWCSFTFSMTF